MKSEQDLIHLTEALVRGELLPAEAKAFEELRAADPETDQKVVAHLNLMKQLSEFGDQLRIKAELEDIHADVDVAAIRKRVLPGEVIVKRLWAKHRFNVGIAASVALFTLMSTLMFTGYFVRKADLQDLRSEIQNNAKKQALINRGNAVVPKVQRGPVTEGKYGGTGFAIGANYIITGYHIIKGADSLYIQNNAGDAYKVRVVYTEPDYDVAVLQVTDPAFDKFTALPYSIKRSEADPAEDVFTVGFPGGKQVYNRGYLSSGTGYNGDTTAYQASIAVNPGNSGSPLLDGQGNIIGLIKNMQLRAEGVVFATKSSMLLQAIGEIPADSLDSKIPFSKKNKLAGLKRTDQVKKMEKYIFRVKAY